MKQFDSWNVQKKNIQNIKHKIHFSQREIWWASYGINIGREQDGKGISFERPIIIIKKLSSETFICLPITTKKRLARFQVEITHNKIHSYVLLDQVRVFDSKRLIRKVGMVSEPEFHRIKNKLVNII